MEVQFEPKTPFEMYVVEKLEALGQHQTDHITHHREVYGRLWTVAVLIFVGIVVGWIV